MPDQKISEDLEITSITTDVFFPCIDIAEALAEDRNKKASRTKFDDRYAVKDGDNSFSGANTFTGINTFNERVRLNTTTYSSNAAETLGAFQNCVITGSTVNDLNLPVSPVLGDWYHIANISSVDISLNYNGGAQIFGTSAANSVTIYSMERLKVVYNGTYWVIF